MEKKEKSGTRIRNINFPACFVVRIFCLVLLDGERMFFRAFFSLLAKVESAKITAISHLPL
jgi:hypothetical protein